MNEELRRKASSIIDEFQICFAAFFMSNYPRVEIFFGLTSFTVHIVVRKEIGAHKK